MPTLTPQQAAAVQAVGNVLVVAGAGTGKTATMVARVLDQVDRAENPVPLDRILMVTFTQKAAAEMRARLRSRLEERLRLSERPQVIERQLLLLDRASIGTLHSICLSWVREYANELGLDPGFRVANEVEAWRLRQAALTATFETVYTSSEAVDHDARDLLHRYFDDDEGRARRTILRIYDHMRSLASPAKWLERQQLAWSRQEPESWRQELLEFLPEWVEHWLDRVRRLPGDNCKAPDCRGVLDSLAQPPFTVGKYADGFRRLTALDEVWPRGRKTSDRPPLDALFEEALFLSSTVSSSEPGAPDPLAEDWNLVRQPVAALLALTARFETEFALLKRREQVADFADIEQFTLALLRLREGALAEELRAGCHAIFVDEYQDINAAQDAILKAVSAPVPPGNRFLVGDLKQSIYRFRRADPRLFHDYITRWNTEAESGRVLTLTANFRSAESIVDFVNAVFRHLFEPGVSGFTYDERSALRFGAPEARQHLARESGKARVEMLLQLTGGTENAGDESVSALEVEASAVAARLAELRARGFLIVDEATHARRALQWGDIAILLRSPGSKAQAFARELARHGIPVALRTGGFLEQFEVRDLWNLLRILDNPLQDYPVAAVLRSPLAGLRDVNDLAPLRYLYPDGLLWDALRAFDRDAPADPRAVAALAPGQREAMRTKIRRFLERYDRWRDISRRGPVSALLELVLDETLYEALVSAGETDGLRGQTIRQFVELSHTFEEGAAGGLARFLAYLADCQTLEAAGLGQEAAAVDAVQIMSVHASKGLEFPVTVVANLGGPFNERDRTEPFFIDEEGGLAPVIVTPDGRSYPSSAFWLAGRRHRSEMLAEELRLLYVAFTRARDLLILSGSYPAKRAGDHWPISLGESGLLAARRPLDWLGPALGEASARPHWFGEPEGLTPLFAWKLIPPGRRLDPVPGGAEEKSDGSASVVWSEDELAIVAERFRWRYPGEGSTREPAKSAVTVLRKRSLFAEVDEAGTYIEGEAPRRPARDSTATAAGAADRGTAHHLVLELLDLSRPCDLTDLRSQADGMVAAGRMTVDQLGLLDFESLAQFWSSSLGSNLRQHRDQVRREWAFTAGFTAGELRRIQIPVELGVPDDERIIVQGVIDLAWMEKKRLRVLDFKTDRVRPDEVSAKGEKYRPQLALYALALERILGGTVTERWLHFLTPQITLRVE